VQRSWSMVLNGDVTTGVLATPDLSGTLPAGSVAVSRRDRRHSFVSNCITST